ncbi:FAD:protein FMN transferase [Mycoplasmatota bacterium]|nr:FAD:protein FMN transferase [Mycoplasmatota bacterium]
MRKLITLSILVLTIILTGCQKKEIQQIQQSGIDYYQYFDTIITIQVWDTKSYSTDSNLWEGAEDIIQHIQRTFQRTKPLKNEDPSELYLLNQSAGSGEAFKCSDDLYEVIKIGMDFANTTNGKFDPTIGPLVDLWDIHSVEESHPAPTDTQIKSLLPLTNYQSVQMNDEEKTVLLPKEGMIIDLGAIAKGFAADKLVEYFEAQGIKHAIINLGGNIYVLGSRFEKRTDGTENWSIGIRDPKQDISSPLGRVFLTDSTVVTSGVYERYIIDPNTQKMYHHILDPDTGYPAENNISSVTILTKSSTTADALSTSIFTLGVEEGLKFIENYEGVEAVFIDSNMKVYKSSGVDSIYHFELL